MNGLFVAMNLMVMLFGTDNMQPPSLARTAIARMNRQTEVVGDPVSITKMARQRRDPCSRMNDVKARYFKYACMKDWAQKHGYLKQKRVFSALIPPATGDGELWSYGFASGTCDLRYGFTMSTFAKVNAHGQDRTEHSLIALVHELAHIRGAKHDQDNANVMHEDALPLVGPTRILGFNLRALIQMQTCVR